jgi:predicted RNA-binding protein with RPS1 domain
VSESLEVSDISESVKDVEVSATVELEKPADPIVVGNIYTATVTKIKPFGAIASLPGDKVGLVHISQIADKYVQSVEDIMDVDDIISVRVISIDEHTGKISLSMKDVPQLEYDEDNPEGGYYMSPPPEVTPTAAAAFEEKFKAWQKSSNERIAGLNKRNKRR